MRWSNTPLWLGFIDVMLKLYVVAALPVSIIIAGDQDALIEAILLSYFLCCPGLLTIALLQSRFANGKGVVSSCTLAIIALIASVAVGKPCAPPRTFEPSATIRPC